MTKKPAWMGFPNVLGRGKEKGFSKNGGRAWLWLITEKKESLFFMGEAKKDP